MTPYPALLTALLLGLVLQAPPGLAATCNPTAPQPPLLTQATDCFLFAGEQADAAIDTAQGTVGDGVEDATALIVFGGGVGADTATFAGEVVVDSGAVADDLAEWGTQTAMLESGNALQFAGCTVWGSPAFACPPPPLPWLPPPPPCVVPLTPPPSQLC